MKTTARAVSRSLNWPVPAQKPESVPLPWTEEDRAAFAVVRAATTPARPPSQPAPRCEGPAWPRSDHYYPPVFVRVPRAVFDQWWPQPWAAVLAAAEAGTDGLAVATTRPRVWRGLSREGAADDPDVAYLAEGQDHWRGRTVLFQQNW